MRGKEWKEELAGNIMCRHVIHGLTFALSVLLATIHPPEFSNAQSIETPHMAVFAYAKTSGMQADIWTISADGTTSRQLTSISAWDEHPSWSPDGARLVYHSGYGEIDTYSIWVMNSDGSNKIRLTPPATQLSGLWPSWSPEGSRIAFSALVNRADRIHLYQMQANGENPKILTTDAADDVLASWTPDGRILFLRKQLGLAAPGDVFSINPDGTGLVQLTTLGLVGGYALSPDGTMLAIHNTKLHRVEILVLSDPGRTITVLDNDFGSVFLAISWSPDGSLLAVARSDIMEASRGSDLYVIDPKTLQQTIVTNTGYVFDPIWCPK